MLLTEKEAREKWCPVEEHKCLITNCMAWRWFDYKTSSKSRWDDGLSRGYCGLAGKVEE